MYWHFHRSHLSPFCFLILAAGALPFLFGEARGIAPGAEPFSPGNAPPVCIIEAPAVVGCQGDVTAVYLDASQSFDPEGAPLEFTWTTNCGQFDDPTSPTPTLLIDTSETCDRSCAIRLRLSDGERRTFCCTHLRVVSALELHLDIKPGSCPNPIQVGSGGTVPVSLLGTAVFDVSTVVVSSLLLGRSDGTFGQVAPVDHHFEDTGAPFKGELCDCHESTGDGWLDLGLRFDAQELVATLGLDEEPNGTEVRLRLEGELTSGESFFAEDCIRVQGN